METKRLFFWLRLCLANLAVVALLGLALRTKFLVAVPFLDYKNFLNAHSHFAFAGWAGLALMALQIYTLLPPEQHRKKIYQWILGGVEFSAVGMLFTFPFQGYAGLSIFFSTLYILITYVFAGVFLRDLWRSRPGRPLLFLATGSAASLVISSIGPFGLAWMLTMNSTDAILYRDFIYTYLHFQYNGFFILAVFALVFGFFKKRGVAPDRRAYLFALFQVLSVLPALFLSLLWHNNGIYYGLSILGCLLLLISLFYLIRFFWRHKVLYTYGIPLARLLFLLSVLSFILKSLLNLGPLFPTLETAAYADRPLIIGFLHLVFLGVVTFYLLSYFLETGIFTSTKKIIRYPVIIFSVGIIANQSFLMIQGLQILFKSNSFIYYQLLWIASLILATGALMMMITAMRTRRIRRPE